MIGRRRPNRVLRRSDQAPTIGGTVTARMPPIPSAAPKAVLLAALGVIVSPLDLPVWIPLVGELDVLALGLLAVETFIEACPADIRREHEALLKAKQSIWDRDVRDTVSIARHGVKRLVGRIRSRVRHRDDYQSISEVV